MDQEDPQQPPKKTAEQRQQEALDNWMSDMKDFNEFLLEARTLTAGLEFKLPELKMPNWFKTTSHGSERLAGNLATRGGVLSLREAWTTRILGKGYTQTNGATAYLRQLSNGRYNVAVWGERGIMTTMKGFSQKSINKLAKNYGWKL